jgi:hypothetical protein
MSTGKGRTATGTADTGAEARPGADARSFRMETPARADRVTVEELLRWAKEGRIRMPTFQRGLTWDSEDKWKLLDSIERGYPIGTLLLWKRPATTDDIGAPLPRGPIPPTKGDVYLVVDGQQRLSTLWESLVLEPEGSEPAMVFDVENERFVMRPLKRRATGLAPALPMHLALDAVTLSEWIPPALPREVKSRYYEVGKRLREYLVPIYVIEGDDVELLRRVFDRTNSTGKPLTRDQVFDALVGSRVARDGQAGLGLVLEQLRDLGFGPLDRSTVLKAFEGIRGEKIGKVDPRTLDARAAEADLVRTAAALRRAIAFLRDIGVPHVAVLPYELPLVVLARMFDLYSAPDEKSLVLLRRWFWRGAVLERQGGASGSLQQHIDDIRPDDEHASVQRLLARTGKSEEPDLANVGREDVSIATARGKIILCALLHHVPRDLRTGEKIAPELLCGDETQEATLRIVQPTTSKLGSAIANRLLHPAVGLAPSRLLRECNDEGALASHGVDPAAERALREGDVQTFLEHRADVLTAWIRTFIEQRAEWERPDTPPVKALAHRKRAS